MQVHRWSPLRLPAGLPAARAPLGRCACVLAAWVMCATGASAAAPVSQRDLETCLRTLGFLQPVLTGTVRAAIVYPHGSAAGLAQAQQIAALFGTASRAGFATIVPRVTELEALPHESPVLVVLTEAAVANAGEIARTISGRSVLTVAFRPAPVEADQVVMAVETEPRVEILISRVAAQQAGVSFAAAFRMLIRER